MEHFLKYRDVEFFVNEKKKTVTCKLKPPFGMGVKDLISVVSNHPSEEWRFERDRIEDFLFESLMNKLSPSQIVAVAKCSPADEFNVQVGKEIAFLKLEKKLSWALAKECRKTANFLNNIAEVATFFKADSEIKLNLFL